MGLAVVYFAAFTSIFFVLSILWQAGLGHAALDTGIVLVPFALGSIIASSLSDRLSRRLGRNVLLLGTLLVPNGVFDDGEQGGGTAFAFVAVAPLPASSMVTCTSLTEIAVALERSRESFSSLMRSRR